MTGDPVTLSKFLSYVLRHHPEVVGLTLDGAGWVGVAELLAALERHGHGTDEATLAAVVAGTDKRRFELAGGRIRAAQGHSVPVELGLAPAVPPEVLYHGTVARFLPGILAAGLRPGRRTHVHLSPDRETAAAVGARRGTPVVLRVDAGGLHRAGHPFYRAANGVWLTPRVPADRLTEDT